MDNLKHVVGGPLQQNLDQIVKEMEALAARLATLEGYGLTKRSRGTGTATWTAAVSSAAVVVPHGLGTTPVAVITTTRGGGVEFSVTARDATNFTVVGYTTNIAVFTGSSGFDWEAIA